MRKKASRSNDRAAVRSADGGVFSPPLPEKPQRGKRIATKIFRFLGSFLLFCGIAGVTALLGTAWKLSRLPEDTAFAAALTGQSQTSLLYDRAGNVFAALHDGEDRYPVTREQLPDTLVHAFIAIEDKRFYNHPGIDLKRTLGAVKQLVTGGKRYGGSTLTQQLVKNVTGESEITLRRKLREMSRSLRLEKAYSKDEILTLYLNTIPMGQHCYGVEAAARHYFGKSVGELTPAECASLAAIPKAPSRYDPIRHPEANRQRRELVLSEMLAQGTLSVQAYRQALAEPLTVQEKEADSRPLPVRSWYTDAVLDEAVEILQATCRMDPTAARKRILQGGLRIYTAMDSSMQSKAEAIYQSSASFPAVDKSFVQPESAAVIVDAHTGGILALVGGRGEKQADRVLNYATDTTRPPGSAIKPLSVYAPAMQKGLITYGTVIDDTPATFSHARPSGWPRNYPAVYRGLTPIHDAITRSVNTVAVKVLRQMGTAESYRFLSQDLGISSLVVGKHRRDGSTVTDLAEAPLALGQLSYGVSVKELTGGYTCLADEGVFHAPHTVEKICTADGTLLFEADCQGKRVLDVQKARILNQMLKEVTARGTASRLTLAKKTDVAGKTGTTGEDCDRWFVGYTPDLVCGVWFGYAYPRSLQGFSETASPALRTWDLLMSEIYRDSPESFGSFSTEGLIRAAYCRDSGKLITSACLCDPRGSRTEIGYFTKDTLPTEGCDCHVLTACDLKQGGVLCEDALCRVRYYGLLQVSRDFPRQIYVSDAQYTLHPLNGAVPAESPALPYYANALPPGHFSGISHTHRPFNRAAPRTYEDDGEPAA